MTLAGSFPRLKTNMARVLITRTQPGADETAARLASAGYSPIVSPVLSLVALPHDLNLGGAQGLVFTSANGVRFFSDVSARRDLRAWCVGPATLAAAQAAGFQACEHADGNADDLAALIIRKARPDSGALIHVANQLAAGDLAKTLQNAGFETVFAPLYAPVQAAQVSPEAAAALSQEHVDAVLIHSAKGADAFAALAANYNLSRVHCVAVSANAAAPLTRFAWAGMHVATRPNEAALMTALSQALISV